MQIPKTTIIIPVYNTEQYLYQCLNSVITQTLREIEIIIVNDASTDNSFKIIKEFQEIDLRIKVITFKVNKGLSIARNTAIDLAKGKYIFFLDSDDWLEPYALETVYNKAIKTNAEIVMFGFENHYNINENTRQVTSVLPSYKEDDPNFFKYFLVQRKGFTATAWTYLYSKKLLVDNAIYFTEGIYFEDVPFTMQVFYYTQKVSVVNNLHLYNYRVMRENSITKSLNKKKIEDLYSAHLFLKDFLIKKEVFKKYEKEYLVRFYTSCVRYSFRQYLLMRSNESDEELDGFMRDFRKSDIMALNRINILKEYAIELDKEESYFEKYLSDIYRFLGAIRVFYRPYHFIYKRIYNKSKNK